MLDEDELEAIDDWRFEQRMPSRASAVRELLRIGLEAIKRPIDQSKRSGDYGVLNEKE